MSLCAMPLRVRRTRSTYAQKSSSNLHLFSADFSTGLCWRGGRVVTLSERATGSFWVLKLRWLAEVASGLSLEIFGASLRTIRRTGSSQLTSNLTFSGNSSNSLHRSSLAEAAPLSAGSGVVSLRRFGGLSRLESCAMAPSTWEDVLISYSFPTFTSISPANPAMLLRV